MSAQRRFVHLFGLCAFALSQPLFDLLSRFPDFFAARHSTPWEVLAYVLISLLIPPAVLLAVEVVAGAMSLTLQRLVRIGNSSILVALFVLPVIKRLGQAPWTVVIAAAALSGLLFAVLLERATLVRTFVLLLGVAAIIFPLRFLFFSPVYKIVFPRSVAVSDVEIQGDIPVVFVIFDALSHAAMLDEDGRLDSAHFPNFARLAEVATWYRNTTTVATVTAAAIPAMLTGRYHKQGLAAITFDHPNNLFTLLGRSYTIDATEACTNLCPDVLRLNRERESAAVRYRSLFSDLLFIYLQVVLPPKLAAHCPDISEQWGGFGTAALSGASISKKQEKDLKRRIRRGQHNKIRERRISSGSRDDVFLRFVSRLDAHSERVLYYFHLNAPHYPFQFVPSGRYYNLEEKMGVQKVRSERGLDYVGDPVLVDQLYQRYLLQAGFVDTMLGEMIDAMKSNGLFDRALIIVTSDHGQSFRANGNLRLPTPTTLAETAMVPLFIKLPGQQSGRVETACVETVDILPTIADILGSRLYWPIDGQSLVAESFEPRDTRQLYFSGENLSLDCDSESITAAERSAWQRKAEALRGVPATARPIGKEEPVELLDQPVASFRIGSGQLRARLDKEAILGEIDLSQDPLPLHLAGTVTGPRTDRGEPFLALAMNGTFASITKTFRADETLRFSFFLPERFLRGGTNQLEVFELRPSNGFQMEIYDTFLVRKP